MRTAARDGRCVFALIVAMGVAGGCEPSSREAPVRDPNAGAANAEDAEAVPVAAETPAAESNEEGAPAAPSGDDVGEVGAGADTAVEADAAPEPEALRLPPEDDGRVMQAWSLIVRGQYEQAERLLGQVLAAYPDCSQAAFFLGVSYQKQKDYVRARRQFEEVIASGVPFERDETVYYFYGWSLYWLGEREAAREAFETHLAAAPGWEDSLFALGLISFEEDRLEDARAELQTSIDLWPIYPHTYYKLYRVLTRLGDEEGAEAARRTYEMRLRGYVGEDDG